MKQKQREKNYSLLSKFLHGQTLTMENPNAILKDLTGLEIEQYESIGKKMKIQEVLKNFTEDEEID